MVELEDKDVLFIEGLPPHIHLNEAVQWYWNPNVEVYATNDAYRGTPKTLEDTRKFYAGKGAELYFMSFDDGKLKLVSTEKLY